MNQLVSILENSWALLRPGTQLAIDEPVQDRYRLGPVVGIGGTAVVFSATDEVLNRTVALKIWHPLSIYGRDSTGAAAAIFRREAETLAKLRHAHLCTVFDYGLLDARLPWIVMELVEGDRLRDRLIKWKNSKPADHTLEAVLHVAVQLVTAVAYLHERGLCQLDLKPENVLLDRSGIVKVIDVATALDRGDYAVTAGAARVGTPGYVAPEVIASTAGGIDPRGDVFSLGIILVELCCLENDLTDGDLRRAAYSALQILEREVFMEQLTLMFFSDSRAEISQWGELYRKAAERLDFRAALKKAAIKVPSGLIDLITEMASVDPSSRPPHAGEVLRRLLEIEKNTYSRGRVFLSHSSADKARFVEKFAGALRERAVDVWYDTWELRTGEPFWDRISEEIERARFVVVVLSANSLKSSAVGEESRMARLGNMRQVKLLPVLIDDLPIEALPIEVRARQVMRFPLPSAKKRFAAAVDTLVSEMQSLARD